MDSAVCVTKPFEQPLTNGKAHRRDYYYRNAPARSHSLQSLFRHARCKPTSFSFFAAPLPGIPAFLDTMVASFSFVFAVLAALTTALPAPLQPRQFNSTDTLNQLTDGAPCRSITVIYARGTTQDGNIGAAGDVGPLFFNALAANVGGADKMAVQGVDYDATVIHFLEGGDSDGGDTMADLTNRAASQCPSTKIVMAGYSQGGQIVHKAAEQLSADVSGKVTAGKSAHSLAQPTVRKWEGFVC
jgi:hypothetical protein